MLSATLVGLLGHQPGCHALLMDEPILALPHTLLKVHDLKGDSVRLCRLQMPTPLASCCGSSTPARAPGPTSHMCRYC